MTRLRAKPIGLRLRTLGIGLRLRRRATVAKGLRRRVTRLRFAIGFALRALRLRRGLISSISAKFHLEGSESSTMPRSVNV